MVLLVATTIFPIDKKNFSLLAVALLFRIAFTFSFYGFVRGAGSDSWGYFLGRRSFSNMLPVGSAFVTSLTQAFVSVTQHIPNSFLATFIPFGILAYAGSIFLYFALKKISSPASFFPAM